ncbi:MAG: DUF177 domain-containing protein [Anaerolineae bacterium]|nr:DUF177 domain-containing protein [Anaerolineae bacterium]
MSALPELQFNVAQLLKEATGATRSYEVNAKIKDELDNEVIVVSPLIGQVVFLHTGPNVLVTGQLQTTIQKSCGRCLADFTSAVSIELEEIFYPVINVVTGIPLETPEEADSANLIDEHNILDLSEVVRQELLVTSDGILYCRPDCKGLCPHCGQDRNVTSCDCEDNTIDPRWAGLQTLQIAED